MPFVPTILAVLSILLAVAVAATPAEAARRVALVIGNGADATAGTLANPPSDARGMKVSMRLIDPWVEFEKRNGAMYHKCRSPQRIDFENGRRARAQLWKSVCPPFIGPALKSCHPASR